MPRRPSSSRLAVLVLAVLAYVPALASSPGRMPADTKLYLYLDPGGLVRGAPWAWDPQQFGGWVPHQMISYLWPSGPFYWVLDSLGLPDWVAHRLWIGTLFFLAGWGVLVLARRLGLPVTAALVAGFVYQCTPFLVPYVSRTSLMLLPWAALGWVTLSVLHAYRLGSWRWAAVSALLIGTIGGVNGTAFLMIVPAPVLLVAWEWVHGRLAVRRVVVVTARLTLFAVAISLWWVVMLSLQGRYGAEVLSYSETLEGVSFTSTSPEVLRSMGYWLAYIRDPYAPATTAALRYMTSVPLIIVSYAVPLLCMLGLLFTRWRYRGFAALLCLTGFVLSVGFHPYEDPAPLFAPFRDSGVGLALRSSTRALPLLAMGLGLAAGALVTAIRLPRPTWGRYAAGALAVLAVVNLPSLWRAEYVDPALERDQDPPDAWLDAAATLNDPTQRVLQLPGSEFGAFRWGYTVDPPLPGLMDAPLVTRDLLPLGSAGVMDLLYALDNRVQVGSLDPRSVAPVARLLGADHLWLSNDLAFERFRTPRPERFAATLSGELDGVDPVRSYGEPAANVPDIPMVDEDTFSDPLVGTPIAPVALRTIDGAAPMIATTDRFVVVDGSGDGIVDAATAGWLTGVEPVTYVNDLTAEQLAALPPGTLRLVTDSNRDRTLQWRSSQDTVGMTESGGPGSDGLRTDPQNQRLPLFASDDAATQTIAVLDGGTAQASTYGEAFAFLPEYRAAMAVDGDASTAWLAGQRFPPIGETLTLSSVPDGALRIVQSQDPLQRLMITAIEVTDVAGTTAHQLDETSLSLDGQTIPVSDQGEVMIRITAVGDRPGAPRTGTYFVGFAEVGPVFPSVHRGAGRHRPPCRAGR
jgi:arabinofuranan 3-O-arabinosyltransferase